jgi:hypothetical protein
MEIKMKRVLLAALVVGVSVSGLFVLRPGPINGQSAGSSQAAEPCPAAKCQDKAKTCCESTKKKDDAEVVAELVKILNETKSGDTFVATLMALSQFEDKSPLPVVVRNAARLGLLKGMSKDENPTRAHQLVGAYLSGEMAADCCCPEYCPCGQPMNYMYSKPASRWNAPPPPPPAPVTCISAPAVSGPSYLFTVPQPSPAAPAAEAIHPAPKPAPAQLGSPYGTTITAPKNPELRKD